MNRVKEEFKVNRKRRWYLGLWLWLWLGLWLWAPALWFGFKTEEWFQSRAFHYLLNSLTDLTTSYEHIFC